LEGETFEALWEGKREGFRVTYCLCREREEMESRRRKMEMEMERPKKA
jgi:hypothetical protein